uniref:Uncharacterized protein n=1 Tax=Beihai levi-like virus 10 TaxID=1922395 RepID=A0A1L3KI20_9VIRU|nr:hypothetical protein [Beihai levi-like virus 10]
MSFPETITITIDGVAVPLIRINSGKEYASEYRYRGTTDEFTLNIRHTTNVKKASGVRINRHNAELIQRVFAVDPDDLDKIRKVYMVIEEEASDSVTDVSDMTEGFVAFLDSANVTKLLNYES